VFFQSVLLAGYAYADLTHRLGARRQALLHVGLLALSLIFLPIFASSDWKPQGDEQPIARICCFCWPPSACLLPAVDDDAPAGVVLAPLPQPRALSPVRALQLASLLALVGFPLVFEPALDLKQLGWMCRWCSPASSSFARSPRGCR